MGRVDVEGLQVAYERTGTGPPVVLLHGGACDGRVWREHAERLAADFTVVVWDAPGCGASQDPPEHFTLPDYARCLARLLDALDLRRPHVVGHSWGGGLALLLAATRPEIPASLVVVGGYAGWAGSLPPDEVARRLEFALRAAESLPGGFEPAAMPGLFSPRLPPQRAAELARVMSEIRPVGTRVMARAFAEADLRPVLGRVTAPVLLLNGTGDERAAPDVARALHDALPVSELVLLPGLGHYLYLEDPDEFERQLRHHVAVTGAPA